MGKQCDLGIGSCSYQICFSVSTTKPTGVLIEIALNVWIKLERSDILKILNLVVHENETSLHFLGSFLFHSLVV